MNLSWKVQDDISKHLAGMVTRANTVSSYLNRNVLRQYFKAQQERWETQNASQTGRWPDLTAKYLKQKKRMQAGSAAAGQFKRLSAKPPKFSLASVGALDTVMVLTDRLRKGATGQDSAYYLKDITNTKFEVSINTSALPYAVYPGRQRPFMEFTDETEQRWRDGIMAFITGEIAEAA